MLHRNTNTWQGNALCSNDSCHEYEKNTWYSFLTRSDIVINALFVSLEMGGHNALLKRSFPKFTANYTVTSRRVISRKLIYIKKDRFVTFIFEYIPYQPNGY